MKPGLDEVGVYRLSGSTTEVAQLKQIFNCGTDIDLTTTLNPDPHAVASMFKSFFRELPEPLLTNDLARDFTAISASLDGADPRGENSATDPTLLREIATICRKLPRENYNVLSLLFAHLHKVQARSATNKMTVSNLQVIFSPTLEINSTLLATFILNHDKIF
ncbi:Rho GTPase-activating protein domain-containing protein, partial [Blyttiomyces helicus]